MTAKLRILLTEDHLIVREIIKLIINSQPNIEVGYAILKGWLQDNQKLLIVIVLMTIKSMFTCKLI